MKKIKENENAIFYKTTIGKREIYYKALKFLDLTPNVYVPLTLKGYGKVECRILKINRTDSLSNIDDFVKCEIEISGKTIRPFLVNEILEYREGKLKLTGNKIFLSLLK